MWSVCVCVYVHSFHMEGGYSSQDYFFFFRTIFKVVVPRKYRVDHSCWKHGRKGAVNKGKRNEGERLFEKKKKKVGPHGCSWRSEDSGIKITCRLFSRWALHTYSSGNQGQGKLAHLKKAPEVIPTDTLTPLSTSPTLRTTNIVR